MLLWGFVILLYRKHSKSIGLNVVVQFKNQEKKGVKWALV